MKCIIIDKGQNGYCVAEVPDYIADDVQRYQSLFDQWLWDRNATHSYMRDLNGECVMMYDGATAFIEWLNEYGIDGFEKAKITFDNVPMIHF